MARLIYSREGDHSDDKDRKKRLAAVLMALGDLHMEIGKVPSSPLLLLFHAKHDTSNHIAENFPRAVEDYQGCFEQLRTLVDPLDRQLAEISFKMAVAYQFDKSYDKAKEGVQLALGVLEGRLSKVKDTPQGKGKGKETSLAQTDEVKELEELIVIMKEKLDDVEFQISHPAPATGPGSTLEFLTTLLPQQGATSHSFQAAGSSSSSFAPVKDLSGLVRSKKADPPTEGSSSSSSTPAPKKQRIE